MPPDQRPPVPAPQTALAQWFFADNPDTESALRDVIASASEHPHLRYCAQQRLACLCLQQGREAEALELFQELAALGPTESASRAFGLAGQCSVYTLRQDAPAATATLAKLWPIRSELKDPPMRQVLQHTLQELRSQAGQSLTQPWQEWLDAQFPSPR